MFLSQKWGIETRENDKLGLDYGSCVRTVIQKNAHKWGKLKYTMEQWLRLLKSISNLIENKTINRLCMRRLILKAEIPGKIKAETAKHVKWRVPVIVTEVVLHLS